MSLTELQETRSGAAAAVQRGAELLDSKLGLDWPFQVDLARLNMASNWECLLGQLFNSYSAGIVRLGSDLPDAPAPTCSCCEVDLGAVATHRGFFLRWDEADWGYSDLDLEWRELILRLRQERPSQLAQN